MESAQRTVWIIAGETSGDLYGAWLARELRALSPGIRIVGMGAAEMRAAGVEILVDSTELGVVGAVEIVSQIGTFIRIFLGMVARAVRERPAAVVLIDYPGFNIRFARKMHEHGIPVIWYISPQVWAWRKSNIPKLAKYCRKMLLIFPFEPETYAGTGLDAEFVGHPLVDLVRNRADSGLVRDPNLVLLLPGSRRSEIHRLLRPMLDAATELSRRHPELRFVIAAPREKIRREIEATLQGFCESGTAPKIEIDCGRTGYWMQVASTGLAASGTVTVECAIAGLPLVSIYRLNPITYFGAGLVITLFRGFFTMVNIIADRMVFEEYVQDFVRADHLVPAVERILPGGERREQVLRDMAFVTQHLTGGRENVCRNAAVACLRLLAP
jgi:lipid-A-disaccharide synthase